MWHENKTLTILQMRLLRYPALGFSNCLSCMYIIDSVCMAFVGRHNGELIYNLDQYTNIQAKIQYIRSYSREYNNDAFLYAKDL